MSYTGAILIYRFLLKIGQAGILTVCQRGEGTLGIQADNLWTVQQTKSVHCTLYTVQCRVYTVHCTAERAILGGVECAGAILGSVKCAGAILGGV